MPAVLAELSPDNTSREPVRVDVHVELRGLRRDLGEVEVCEVTARILTRVVGDGAEHHDDRTVVSDRRLVDVRAGNPGVLGPSLERARVLVARLDRKSVV